MLDRMKQRESHFESFLGPAQRLTDAPRPAIDQYQFGPSRLRPFYTLVTTGVSDHLQARYQEVDVPPRIEFMMYANEPRPWMAHHLTHLAELIVTERESVKHLSMIHHEHSMTGEPSQLTTSLFVWPVLDQEGFSPMIMNGEQVEFMLVIPITDGERRLAMTDGVETLMKRFVNRLDPVIDEQRACLVDDNPRAT